MRELIVLLCIYLPIKLSAQTIDSNAYMQKGSIVDQSMKLAEESRHSLGHDSVKLIDSILCDRPEFDSDSCGNCYFNWANQYFKNKEYIEAEKWYQKSKQTYSKLGGSTNPAYLKSVTSLGLLYREVKNYKASKKEYLQLKAGLSDGMVKDSAKYIECLNALGLLSMDMENFPKAKNYLFEAKNIQVQYWGKEHQNNANTLNLLAILYKKMGRYEDAMKYYLEALNIREKSIGKENLLYTISLLNLATFYKELGLYEHAETAILDVMNIRKKVYGKKHPYYATTLENLASLYKEMCIYDKAIALYSQVNAIRLNVLGKDNLIYSTGLNNLAILYSEIGNYTEAILLYLEALTIVENKLGKLNPQYAEIQNSLAECYTYIGNYSKAKTILIEALHILDSVVGKWNTRSSNCLCNYAFLQNEMGECNESEKKYMESLKILKRVYGKEHYKCAEVMHDLAALYRNVGKYSKADSLFKEVKRIREKVFGKKHLLYNLSLEELADLYELQRKYSNSGPLFKEAYQFYQDRLTKGATFLSEEELGYYSKSFMDRNDKLANYLISRPKQLISKNSLSTVLLDNVIFSKGFLLTSAVQLNHLPIYSLETEELQVQLKTLNRRLYAEYAKPKAEQKEVSKLEAKSNEIEKALRRMVSGYANVLAIIKWEQVQKVLKKDEVAIEFIHFESLEKEKVGTYYAAFLLKPGIAKPDFIELCTEESLDSLVKGNIERKADYVNSLYSYMNRGAVVIEDSKRSLYEILWKPLENQLSGCKKIYFSPSGLLHRINLAAIPISETESLADKFQLIELNSTRQLVVPIQIKNANNNAVLFGGIQFEQDSTIIQKINLSTIKTRGEISFNYQDTTSRGGSWNYLVGTEREVNSLEQIIRTAGVEVSLKKAYNATEEAFKSIGTNNDPSPRILHIATHGYFFPDSKESRQSSVDSRQKEPVFKMSDHSMLRSGLIMAGGNAAWQGKQTLEGREDGILTAYEIAQMNLSNTELVVLSACETGLGDIQGNEGVYGLQRAFKIAGAKYLIMSLWQVPDKQTSLLMTTFYKKWLELKMTIPDAFHAAQKELRDNGLDPYNWAGFVLVE